MKRNITKEDIAALNDSQKVSLRELWLPEKYDLAIAYICKNAETEEYDEIDFVVGDIHLYHNHITLIDIRRPRNEKDDALEEDDESSTLSADDDQSSELEEEFESIDSDDSEDEVFDEDLDFEFAYERPTTFSKEDCLPLLSIYSND
ncbi:MAG: hypothetical protein BWY74_03719 [Firmicutes bacterium ADurb.Bin419]|nr:MAG: hypothetical protein BWY74_03719 [Firmicutes bacterium ADurb.Bin419]